MEVRLRLRIDERRQSQLSQVMQVVLVDLVFIDLDRGNLGIVTGTSVSLGVTYLPVILEHDYRIPMDAELTLWVSSTAFLHAPGTVGFPGPETSFHADTWWWDHLTHVLSSPVIAAAGYATVCTVNEHTADIYLPPRFIFVFILLFILVFDVFWEVIEFAISEVASLVGTTSVLVRYGLDDTLLDLVSDAVGGAIVAIWRTAHLSDVVDALQRRFETAPH